LQKTYYHSLIPIVKKNFLYHEYPKEQSQIRTQCLFPLR